MKSKPKPWKKLSSRLILDHKRLKVREDRVELPNGKKSTYVHHASARHHSVAIIAVNKDNQVLIQKEYSYPPDKVMWQLPGGSMKPNETPERAAMRELAEESGYSSEQTTTIGSFFVHNRLSNQKQFVVLCEQLFEQKLVHDEDEFIENNWMTVKKLKNMITSDQFDNINLLAALNIWFIKCGAR